MKYAICDDQPQHAAHLQQLISCWAAQHGVLMEGKIYPQASAFLFDYEQEKDFDLLLLDIEMPGMSGVELAKQIRAQNAAVQIVFVTGYDEYFSDGFDVSALHYLLKPISEARLFPVLDRAAANLAYRHRSVLLTTAEADVKVPLTDILYAEAQNVHVLVHTAQEVFRCRMPLARLQEQLDDTFLKVHRSYVVSLRSIKRITRTDITLSNGDVLPISRGMYDEVHASLVRYL